MPTLIARVIALGCPPALAKPLLGLIAALALLGALWGFKTLYDHRVVANHEAKVEQRARPATDKAATERANDAINQAKNETEAHDAVHSVPDAAPAGPSHALACQRLRKLGRHPASCG